MATLVAIIHGGFSQRFVLSRDDSYLKIKLQEDEAHFEAEQFQNMSIMWMKPVHNPTFQLNAPNSNAYGYGAGLSLIEQAFYLDLTTKVKGFLH